MNIHACMLAFNGCHNFMFHLIVSLFIYSLFRATYIYQFTCDNVHHPTSLGGAGCSSKHFN